MMNSEPYRKAPFYRAAVCLALMGIGLTVVAGRTTAERAKVVSVPLIQRGVHLFVQVTIDDKPALFALDTGAGVNLVTPKAARRLDLTPEKGQISVLGAGGKSDAAPAVKFGTLGVGEAVVKAQSAYIISLPGALACDGLLGTPFFRAWVVQIDYAQLRLTLIPHSSFLPPADASALPIRFYNNIPALEATVDGLKGRFTVDTGAGDAVTLFGPFVAQNHLHDRYSPALQTVTGRGIGGLIYGDLVRLPTFAIGPFPFTRVAAQLSRQTEGAFAGKETAGNLGGEILQRFTLTLDYADNKIFLARNGRYDTPFIVNRSGLALDYEQGTTLVRVVIPNSPASEAGVQEGDAVIGIDGTPIDRITSWDMHEIFRGEPGKKIDLRLRGLDKTEREVTLILRDLL